MNIVTPSVGAFIRGPLVHTQQGIVVLVFSALYLVAAFLFAFADVAPPSPWRQANAVGLSLVWPFILVLLFVRSGYPDFSPSWRSALWLTACAITPGALTIWRA
jgi:hypothetical protein